MAAQTLLDEDYGSGVATKDTTTYTTGEFTQQKVADLAEVDKDKITQMTVANGKVSVVKYTDGKVCTYTQSNGQYVVANS